MNRDAGFWIACMIGLLCPPFAIWIWWSVEREQADAVLWRLQREIGNRKFDNQDDDQLNERSS
jgi:hypothetical protein